MTIPSRNTNPQNVTAEQRTFLPDFSGDPQKAQWLKPENASQRHD